MDASDFQQEKQASQRYSNTASHTKCMLQIRLFRYLVQHRRIRWSIVKHNISFAFPRIEVFRTFPTADVQEQAFRLKKNGTLKDKKLT